MHFYDFVANSVIPVNTDKTTIVAVLVFVRTAASFVAKMSFSGETLAKRDAIGIPVKKKSEQPRIFRDTCIKANQNAQEFLSTDLVKMLNKYITYTLLQVYIPWNLVSDVQA